MQWTGVLFLCFFVSFNSFANKPKLAVVIDDLGFRTMPKEIMNFPPEISIAIIPFTRYDRVVAADAKQQQREFLLHLPMQSPSGPQEKHALKISMTKSEIQRRVEKALYRLPDAVAVNNHMGSLFTQHPERMGWVMETLQRRKLGFLDSRTSAKTVGQTIAKRHGIATNRRHVFLDHRPTAHFIKRQLSLAVKKAKHHGTAIMIAHPLPISLKMLKTALPELQKEVDLIPISAALAPPS